MKSASFPVTGRHSAPALHTPGAEIVGVAENHAEKVITIDGLVLTSAFIANIDEAMNHFDIRSIYSRNMGEAMAQTFDTNIAKEIIKGARATKLNTDGVNGYAITDANLASATPATKYGAWLDSIVLLAEKFDNNWIPQDNRYLAVKPATYYWLLKYAGTAEGQSPLINKDIGGQGSIAEGNLMKIMGFNILSIPTLPFSDTSGSDTLHGVNASTTVGVAWHPEAIGTVKLMDLATESEYDIRRQGTLMIAKMAMGHSWLRPEACAELKTS